MARRRTGKIIADIAEGFSGGFLPPYFAGKQADRLELADQQRFLAEVGGQIHKGWQKEDDLEPYIQSAIDRGMTRKEAITAISPYVRTKGERSAEILRRLGTDPGEWIQEVAEAHAANVGMEDYFREETFLPSRPRSGSVGLAGAPPPLPSRTVSAVSGLPGAPPPVDPSGKLLAPLRIGPLQQPPPGIETGPLQVHEPGWGGPQAEWFDEAVEAAIQREKDVEGRKRVYAEKSQREEAATALAITQEQLEEQIVINSRMSEEESLQEKQNFIAQASDPEYQKALVAIEIKLRTNQELNAAELKMYGEKQSIDLRWTARTLAMTNEPVIKSYIDPQTKKKLITITSWNQNTQRMEITSLADSPHLSDAMKLLLQNKVDYSPHLSRPDTLFDQIIRTVAPNLFLQDGSLDPGQFNQAVQSLVNDTGMSPEAARQRVLQYEQPTGAPRVDLDGARKPVDIIQPKTREDFEAFLDEWGGPSGKRVGPNKWEYRGSGGIFNALTPHDFSYLTNEQARAQESQPYFLQIGELNKELSQLVSDHSSVEQEGLTFEINESKNRFNERAPQIIEAIENAKKQIANINAAFAGTDIQTAPFPPIQFTPPLQ
jgi:hypothetical protein